MARERFGRESLRMCGGLLTWGAHLGGVYAFAGVVCERRWDGTRVLGFSVVPLVVAAATLVALVLLVPLLIGALRDLARRERGGSRRFSSAVTAWVAAFGLVGVLWTALPAVVLRPACTETPSQIRSADPALSDEGAASPRSSGTGAPNAAPR